MSTMLRRGNILVISTAAVPNPDLRQETGHQVRSAARAGFSGLTVGRAPGYTQANLVLLPAALSQEFLDFCRANPIACPVLGHGAPGQSALEQLGVDLDVRTDLPRYTVHRNGQTSSVPDIRAWWQDDLVAVALGCWFGTEAALAAANVRLRHVELGIQGPLFRSNIATVPVGRFNPNLIVSMRPFQTPDVPRIVEITGQRPHSHGAPLTGGTAAGLGLADLDRPDWGERLLPEPGETALFWACGLTATEAMAAAGVDFFITHSPGSMLVTDHREPEGV